MNERLAEITLAKYHEKLERDRMVDTTLAKYQLRVERDLMMAVENVLAVLSSKVIPGVDQYIRVIPSVDQHIEAALALSKMQESGLLDRYATWKEEAMRVDYDPRREV